MHVAVREQLTEVSFLLIPCGFGGLNSVPSTPTHWTILSALPDFWKSVFELTGLELTINS